MPGNSSQAQVIGAHIDLVAVVTDAGPDFNIRQMERYFMLICRSGAKAVVRVKTFKKNTQNGLTGGGGSE